MLLLAFDSALEDLVRLAIFGPKSVSPQGRLLSDYSFDPVSIQRGEKAFQIRLVQESESAPGSNVGTHLVGVEIEVVRKLGLEEDERLYVRNGEMYFDQARLVDQQTWRDITSDLEFDEEPTIGLPERTDQTIHYTVAATVQLNQ